MNIHIHDIQGKNIAEVQSAGIVISNLQDALDLIGNCMYQDAWKIIIREENIVSDFFDLKTGLAGEILQKFSTYRVQLAIIGDHSRHSSKSMQDFIYESNKAGRINFVRSFQEAQQKLS